MDICHSIQEDGQRVLRHKGASKVSCRDGNENKSVAVQEAGQLLESMGHPAVLSIHSREGAIMEERTCSVPAAPSPS